MISEMEIKERLYRAELSDVKARHAKEINELKKINE